MKHVLYTDIDKPKRCEMDKKAYDKQLIKWVRGHYWDSLEKDKDLILRHLRNFTGDEVIYKEPKTG